ncbi:MAG: NUDIX domain-containing protein [Candidatus Nanohaloarchaea archaeon]
MEEAPSYCPGCGSELVNRHVEERDRKYCESCGEVVWQNPKPVTGVAVVGDGEILLIKRGIKPAKGKWSLPAGFIERDEPPEKAAVRELEEETGVRADPDELELMDTVFMEQPGRGYVLGIIYRIDREKTAGEPEAASDAVEAGFHTIEEIQEAGDEFRVAYLETIREALDSDREKA